MVQITSVVAPLASMVTQQRVPEKKEKKDDAGAGLLLGAGALAALAAFFLLRGKASASQLECADAIGPESGNTHARGRSCTAEEIAAGGTQWATANLPEVTDALGTHLYSPTKQWVGNQVTIRFCVKNIGKNAGNFSFCHCNAIFGTSFCNALSGRIVVEPGELATSEVTFTRSSFLSSAVTKTISPRGTDCTGQQPSCSLVGGGSAQWDPPGTFLITRPVDVPMNIGEPTDEALIEGVWYLSGDLVFIKYSDGTQASYPRQLFREAGVLDPVEELPGLTFLELGALVPGIVEPVNGVVGARRLVLPAVHRRRRGQGRPVGRVTIL